MNLRICQPKLEPQLDTVVNNIAKRTVCLGRSVMTKSSFREQALLGRTEWIVTDQPELYLRYAY